LLVVRDQLLPNEREDVLEIESLAFERVFADGPQSLVLAQLAQVAAGKNDQVGLRSGIIGHFVQRDHGDGKRPAGALGPFTPQAADGTRERLVIHDGESQCYTGAGYGGAFGLLRRGGR
jgi:hypothetical protein